MSKSSGKKLKIFHINADELPSGDLYTKAKNREQAWKNIVHFIERSMELDCSEEDQEYSYDLKENEVIEEH